MSYRQNMQPRCPMPSNQAPSCSPCTRPVQEPVVTPSACNQMCHYPIAMAYVPIQTFQSTYDLNCALEVGTIFPELHKPFCGKRCVR